MHTLIDLFHIVTKLVSRTMLEISNRMNEKKVGNKYSIEIHWVRPKMMVKLVKSAHQIARFGRETEPHESRAIIFIRVLNVAKKTIQSDVVMREWCSVRSTKPSMHTDRQTIPQCTNHILRHCVPNDVQCAWVCVGDRCNVLAFMNKKKKIGGAASPQAHHRSDSLRFFYLFFAL